MGNRNPPDPFGDARRERQARALLTFCNDLISVGDRPGLGCIPWRPFIARAQVEAELISRGYELGVDGANHDPALLRFFASPEDPQP